MTYDYTLTFGAASVQLSTAFQQGQTPPTARTMFLQADTGNTHVVYIGGANHGVAVGSGSYGIIIPAPVTSIPAVPIEINLAPAQSVDLSEFWVNGTNGEKLHILLVQ